MNDTPTLHQYLGRPAKIGMITPWGQRCGIAQYTENMVAALRQIGHEVVVIANIPYEDLTHPDQLFVHRLWEVEGRTGKKQFDYNKAVELLSDCDLIHIQGESALYAQEYMPKLMGKLVDIPWCITHHSTCATRIGPNMRFHMAHSEKVLDGLSIRPAVRAVQPMPSPIVDYIEPPILGETLLLRSYGLGRNQDELVQEAVKRVNVDFPDLPNIRFETHYGHHKWIPFSELLRWIQGSHACILYYPPVGAQVTSSNAYLALGCGRPLVVSKTNWFGTLSPDYALFAGNSPSELRTGLEELLVNYEGYRSKAAEYASWLRKNKSFLAVANFLTQIYIEVLG